MAKKPQKRAQPKTLAEKIGEAAGRALRKKAVDALAKAAKNLIMPKSKTAKRIAGHSPRTKAARSSAGGGGGLSSAAALMGRAGAGVPKTITQAERNRRARSVAKARQFRWA
jgi:hypothetical protein